MPDESRNRKSAPASFLPVRQIRAQLCRGDLFALVRASRWVGWGPPGEVPAANVALEVASAPSVAFPAVMAV